MKKIVAFVLVFSLVLMNGFTSDGGAEASSKEAYSGEDLFRGLFFVQGEVAKQLSSEIYTHDLYQTANTKEAVGQVDKIVANVEKLEPGYFNRLKGAVDSKNPLELERALGKGSELIYSALKSDGVNVTSIDSKQLGYASGQCAVAAVVFVAGLAVVWYAGAVAQVVGGGAYVLVDGVYFYHAAVQVKTVAVSYSRENDLTREMYIRNVIKGLK
ncbi:sporulation delaying protein family toxin [Paenibacillus glufosinatiresistens]|uniref:sporulation delaying protein family toxin n=1 Tax=Paenibacillus glufosinatiresistens TaxID=3070657 RepID=UPI00286D89FB|nr:sporulation delaying protein family toxin [Paenibacillus sp. YX.27]